MTDIRDGVEQSGIDTASVTAISTQVWSDKEIIAAYKFFRHEVSLAFATQSVYVTMLNINGGFRAKILCFGHYNAINDSRDIQVKITIDGEVFETAADTLSEDEEYWIYMPQMLMDGRETPVIIQEQVPFGKTYTDWSAAGYLGAFEVEGDTLLIEMRTTSAIANTPGGYLNMEIGIQTLT